MDIAQGEYKDYFAKKYEADSRPEKKWSCIYTQLLDGNSLPYYKSLITAIQNSNAGFIWDFKESELKGKLIGVVFGKEEYINSKNESKFAVKPFYIRSVDTIKKGLFTVPEDKLLGGNTKAYNDFTVVDVEDNLPF